MDLTSPLPSPNSFSAPIPITSSPSQTDQTVTPGAFSPDRSRAKTLSGGELACIPARCSASNCRVASPERSSWRTLNMLAPHVHRGYVGMSHAGEGPQPTRSGNSNQDTTQPALTLQKSSIHPGMDAVLHPHVAAHQRIEQVVLPHAIDAEIFARKALAREPGLFEQPDRRHIGGDARGLEAVQPKRSECEWDERQHAGRHQAAH